jgi:hypothetical protein
MAELTESLRRQLKRVGVEFERGIAWDAFGGHVTNEDNVTRVGRVEFWEEEGKLYAYGLPMTTEEAVARVVRGTHGNVKED